MKKWFRALALSLTATVLVASVSLAGPGKAPGESGDPDIPVVGAIPIRTSSEIDVNSRSRETANTVPSDWKLALRTYLKLLHLFVG
ncbi:MAG: hypothetical protein R3B81_09965 [bacterium]